MSMVAQATPWHEKGHPEGCPSFPGGEARIRTGGEGFAGPCLTTWPLRHMKEAGVTGLGAHMERATGFEPATSTLARWRATNCAKPASARDNIREPSASRKPKFQIRWKKLWDPGLSRSGTRTIRTNPQLEPTSIRIAVSTRGIEPISHPPAVFPAGTEPTLPRPTVFQSAAGRGNVGFKQLPGTAVDTDMGSRRLPDTATTVDLGSRRSPTLGKKRKASRATKKAADRLVDRLQFMERATGFEPATSTLARWRATNCAKPA